MDIPFSYIVPGMPDPPKPGDTWKVCEWSLEKSTVPFIVIVIVIAKVKFAAILKKKTR